MGSGPNRLRPEVFLVPTGSDQLVPVLLLAGKGVAAQARLSAGLPGRGEETSLLLP